MLAACNIIQEFRNPLRHTVGSYNKGAVQMHIALGHAAGRVAEQAGDRQLGKAEIAGYAGKGVTENMWRHVTKLRLRADPVDHPNHPDEMPVAPVGREDILRTFPTYSSVDAGDRGLPENPDLPAAFGVGKTDTIFLWTNPEPFETQYFHSPKSRQKHKTNGRETGRMLPYTRHVANHSPKTSEFLVAKSALPTLARELANALGRVLTDDAKSRCVTEQTSQRADRAARNARAAS